MRIYTIADPDCHSTHPIGHEHVREQPVANNSDVFMAHRREVLQNLRRAGRLFLCMAKDTYIQLSLQLVCQVCFLTTGGIAQNDHPSLICLN